MEIEAKQNVWGAGLRAMGSACNGAVVRAMGSACNVEWRNGAMAVMRCEAMSTDMADFRKFVYF
jgi:hypothetical protein